MLVLLETLQLIIDSCNGIYIPLTPKFHNLLLVSVAALYLVVGKSVFEGRYKAMSIRIPHPRCLWPCFLNDYESTAIYSP